MKKFLLIGAVLLGAVLVLFVVLTNFSHAERYRIVHASFLPGLDASSLPAPGVVCYSSQDLRHAVKATNVLDQAGMSSFNLDEGDLTVIIVSNHVVQEVVGQGGIGFIRVRKSPTNGVSFTIVKGKKRLLQFAMNSEH